ncbi:MAG: hypothetical protein K6F12_05270 [Streptococcus sp.]|nr:hypothetical protein [Streptococcus sp.]MCR5493059.1 hypothetical protein [Streptococcus sp.]
MLVNVFLWLVFVLLVVTCFVWLDKHEELVEFDGKHYEMTIREVRENDA